MKWTVVDDYDALSREAAAILLDAIGTSPDLVLGLPTGRTPEGMYREVVRACHGRYHCFRDVTTFNLDEYAGIPPSHSGSYCSYMKRNLLDHVDLQPSRVHIPDGTAAAVLAGNPELSLEHALAEECERYERAIAATAGLGLTILGLGSNGHIAFNEPGSPFDSRTRVVHLAEETLRANAEEFPGERVPERAITMGIATILASRSILILASGEAKREATRRLARERPSPDFPASALRMHADVTVLVDRAAS
ncbi:MAG TPA: glucosamine-6-phosphate deaminase [Thermoanaerobaculia bacterium]|nr:glucosamine-6-phosphate deaminase [Thermoanaerobaculia bacterium]